MNKTKRLERLVWAAVLASLAGLVSLPCVFSGAAYNYLHYRHVRAYNLWVERQPDHYAYILNLLGSVTYQTYQVEVRAGKLVKLTDMNTGNSVTFSGPSATRFPPNNTWIGNHLLIDDLFLQIQTATRLPKSVQAFVQRANPVFYNRLSAAGWLPWGSVSCDPVYPKATYDPVYGFPEEVFLEGNPCASLDEASYPVHVKIEDLQVLP
jgi:hypothetical protein